MGVSRRFKLVDVFSEQVLRGNPLAVVIDGDGLTQDEMQRFANWMNLSETVFIVTPTSPDANYGLKIFTPTFELPFAGHPTLGACHSWLESGGVSSHGDLVIQQCEAGLIRIRRDGDRLAFEAPDLVRSGEVDEGTVDQVAGVLGIDRSEIVACQWVDNGPGWIGVLMHDSAAVLALKPGFVGDLLVGAIGPTPDGDNVSYEVRAFFPQGPLTVEDPVTGSLNASLAQWFATDGIANAPYQVRQGTALGREGLITIERSGDGPIWVGGMTSTVVDGTIYL